jgi:dihydroxyacetone kinase
VALTAAEKTKELLPKIGRARPHAEKSLGVIDPGALSMAMIIEAMEGTWGS